MGRGAGIVDTLVIKPSELAKTFTLIARPDTHVFLDRRLPEYIGSLAHGSSALGASIAHLRSGEYIAKASYSEHETEYVYLTISQFSGAEVRFSDLTYLDPVVGKKYGHLAIPDESLVVTRSGTVGVVHIFRAPDQKVYIPSHHLAILEPKDEAAHSAEYLRLVLQSNFARAYFWAFASGKGQKEISNWSIKSIPVPVTPDPHGVVATMLAMEREIEDLRELVGEKDRQKQRLLLEAIGIIPPSA
jgi:Type I restriction modification DNA specificity domain